MEVIVKQFCPPKGLRFLSTKVHVNSKGSESVLSNLSGVLALNNPVFEYHSTKAQKDEYFNAVNALNKNIRNNNAFYAGLNKLHQLSFLDYHPNDFYLVIMSDILANFLHLQKLKIKYTSVLIETALKMLQDEDRIIESTFFEKQNRINVFFHAFRQVIDLFVRAPRQEEQLVIRFLNAIESYRKKFEIYALHDSTISQRLIQRLEDIKDEFLINYSLSNGDYYTALHKFKSLQPSVELNMSASSNFRALNFYALIMLSLLNGDSSNFQYLYDKHSQYRAIFRLNKLAFFKFVNTALLKNDASTLSFLILKEPWLLNYFSKTKLVQIIQIIDDLDTRVVLLTKLKDQKYPDFERFLHIMMSKSYIKKTFYRISDEKEFWNRLAVLIDLMKDNLNNSSQQSTCKEVFFECFQQYSCDSVTEPRKFIEYVWLQIKKLNLPATALASISRAIVQFHTRSKHFNVLSLLQINRDIINDLLSTNQLDVIQDVFFNESYLVDFYKNCSRDKSAAYIVFASYKEFVIRPSIYPLSRWFTSKVKHQIYLSAIRNGVVFQNENLLAFYIFNLLKNHYDFKASPFSKNSKAEIGMLSSVGLEQAFSSSFAIIFNQVKNRSYGKNLRFSKKFLNLLNMVNFSVQTVQDEKEIVARIALLFRRSGLDFEDNNFANKVQGSINDENLISRNFRLGYYWYNPIKKISYNISRISTSLKKSS